MTPDFFLFISKTKLDCVAFGKHLKPNVLVQIANCIILNAKSIDQIRSISPNDVEHS